MMLWREAICRDRGREPRPCGIGSLADYGAARHPKISRLTESDKRKSVSRPDSFDRAQPCIEQQFLHVATGNGCVASLPRSSAATYPVPAPKARGRPAPPEVLEAPCAREGGPGPCTQHRRSPPPLAAAGSADQAGSGICACTTTKAVRDTGVHVSGHIFLRRPVCPAYQRQGL